MSGWLGRKSLIVGAILGVIPIADAQIIPIAEQRSAPTDELADLSRRADDPFADLEAQSERKPVSVTLRALDKTTARYVDIEAPIAEVATFGRLEIVPQFCDKRPPEEFPETTAFLQIYDLGLGGDDEGALEDTLEADGSDGKASNDKDLDGDGLSTSQAPSPVSLDGEGVDAPESKPLSNAIAAPVLSDGKVVFSGWMFASSPALNALEHPVYDVWVIDCKTVVESN